MQYLPDGNRKKTNIFKGTIPTDPIETTDTSIDFFAYKKLVDMK